VKGSATLSGGTSRI